MKSAKFLNDLMKAESLKNDAELARFLEWPTSKISQYRTGKRFMDNEACLTIAMKLGIDPMKIIMAADIDRAERAGQHSLWEVFMSRMAAPTASALLALVAVNLFLTPQNAEASTGAALQTVEMAHSLSYVK